MAPTAFAFSERKGPTLLYVSLHETAPQSYKFLCMKRHRTLVHSFPCHGTEHCQNFDSKSIEIQVIPWYLLFSLPLLFFSLSHLCLLYGKCSTDDLICRLSLSVSSHSRFSWHAFVRLYQQCDGNCLTWMISLSLSLEYKSHETLHAPVRSDHDGHNWQCCKGDQTCLIFSSSAVGGSFRRHHVIASRMFCTLSAANTISHSCLIFHVASYTLLYSAGKTTWLSFPPSLCTGCRPNRGLHEQLRAEHEGCHQQCREGNDWKFRNRSGYPRCCCADRRVWICCILQRNQRFGFWSFPSFLTRDTEALYAV